MSDIGLIMMTVVAVSDVHLGYERSEKKAFADFLDWIAARANISDFVIIGDFLDMWRRDMSGVVFENTSILQTVAGLKSKFSVHYVAGNHDYYLIELKQHEYQFEFTSSLELTQAGRKIIFKHGWEFDPSMPEPLFEPLCKTTDDEGKRLSDAFDFLTSGWSWWRKWKEKSKLMEQLEEMLEPAESRLAKTVDVINKGACSSVKDEELLVFGHTHKPFINKKENVANTGSWTSGDELHNTYVELQDGTPRLFEFPGQKEVKDRIEC
jgi:UDP-2,3-diacylglucosamine pyrophosphatase LpxH